MSLIGWEADLLLEGISFSITALQLSFLPTFLLPRQKFQNKSGVELEFFMYVHTCATTVQIET